MTWVRLDDQFPKHPKVAAAGPLAGWLHVCGLCYCNQYLTDGFVPRAVAHSLTHYEHVGLETASAEGGLIGFGNDVTCEWMASVLCEHGVWERVEGGYQIHDYLDYQPSRAEVEELRAKKQAAGQAGGQAAAKARAKASAQAKSKPIPIPKPKPKPQAPEEKPSDLNGFTPLEKLIEWAKRDVDDGGLTIRATAEGLPEAAAARVLEAVQGKKPSNRAAYVVQSLKMERELRGGR